MDGAHACAEFRISGFVGFRIAEFPDSPRKPPAGRISIAMVEFPSAFPRRAETEIPGAEPKRINSFREKYSFAQVISNIECEQQTQKGKTKT